jgi:hypothetical protein
MQVCAVVVYNFQNPQKKTSTKKTKKEMKRDAHCAARHSSTSKNRLEPLLKLSKKKGGGREIERGKKGPRDADVQK